MNTDSTEELERKRKPVTYSYEHVMGLCERHNKKVATLEQKVRELSTALEEIRDEYPHVEIIQKIVTKALSPEEEATPKQIADFVNNKDYDPNDIEPIKE